MKLKPLNCKTETGTGYTFLSGFVELFFLLLMFVLIRNNKQKQKAKTESLKEPIHISNPPKLNSFNQKRWHRLGELTRRYCTEIQNPLNFVNNFAEVNKELLVEMKDEIKKGNLDEVKALANDVIRKMKKK